MKKLIFFACTAIVILAGCNQRKQAEEPIFNAEADSLEKIVAQRDNEINDMMATLNEIQMSFREISAAEDRVSIAKDGEGADRSQQIREDIQFIANKLKENRELIKSLKNKLSKSTFHGDQLQKAIDNLTTQMEEKDKQLQELRTELDKKDIHITELDETINNLNTDVQNLKVESNKKTEVINDQDKQLNTAWFVFGTKKELKEQNILVDGDVLQSNFNKSYFTKIDIRNEKQIKLYSKSARLLTTHPSSSYSLTKDANKQYVLNITNPQIFWSTSKYLVILVK